MLLPFECAILTVEDARIIRDLIKEDLIKENTQKKGSFSERWKSGLARIYWKLDEFIIQANHYEENLCDFKPE